MDQGTDQYKEWRKAVYRRDNGRCQWSGCSYKGIRINVHHIKRHANYPALRYNINNGICLCPKHHRFIKGNEERYEYMFSIMVNRKAYEVQEVINLCKNLDDIVVDNE
jgi:5-methylcytosine-specific restriction endonuclease McrA